MLRCRATWPWNPRDGSAPPLLALCVVAAHSRDTTFEVLDARAAVVLPLAGVRERIAWRLGGVPPEPAGSAGAVSATGRRS